MIQSRDNTSIAAAAIPMNGISPRQKKARGGRAPALPALFTIFRSGDSSATPTSACRRENVEMCVRACVARHARAFPSRSSNYTRASDASEATSASYNADRDQPPSNTIQHDLLPVLRPTLISLHPSELFPHRIRDVVKQRINGPRRSLFLAADSDRGGSSIARRGFHEFFFRPVMLNIFLRDRRVTRYFRGGQGNGNHVQVSPSLFVSPSFPAVLRGEFVVMKEEISWKCIIQRERERESAFCRLL